jgi:hypothetical protein
MESDQQNGMPLKDIAIKYNVSRHALGRHFRKPLKTQTLESQIETWKQRGESLWHETQKNGDVRGQYQALQAGLRSLEMQVKRATEIAELTEQTAPAGKLTIDDIDRIVSGYAAESETRADTVAIESAKRLRDNAARYDPQETPEQRLQSSRRALIYHNLFSMFEACNESSDLRTAVLEFADDQQQREKKSNVDIQERQLTSSAD